MIEYPLIIPEVKTVSVGVVVEYVVVNVVEAVVEVVVEVVVVVLVVDVLVVVLVVVVEVVVVVVVVVVVEVVVVVVVVVLEVVELIYGVVGPTVVEPKEPLFEYSFPPLAEYIPLTPISVLVVVPVVDTTPDVVEPYPPPFELGLTENSDRFAEQGRVVMPITSGDLPLDSILRNILISFSLMSAYS